MLVHLVLTQFALAWLLLTPTSVVVEVVLAPPAELLSVQVQVRSFEQETDVNAITAAIIITFFIFFVFLPPLLFT